MPPKHIPLRTCVVCRGKAPKRDLVRVVSTPAGNLLADDKGKQAGRGAYLCHSPACWQGVAKGNRLSRALRTEISKEARDQLVASSAFLS